ncbi:MAG: MATE family efflux transporter [Clostridia bacterium]|nr:MATE family efflux transporter [Clostridia bacterium]
MSNTNKLTEGPVLKNYVSFIIPVLLTGLLQQFYNSADTMIVGKFAKDGETALAAVGSTASLCALIVTFFTNLSIGTNVVCAKLYGADDKEGLNRAFHTSVLMGIVLGIPLMLVGIFGSKYFLELMGTPDNVIEKATLYMRLFFVGAPANLVYCFASATLRSVGDTRRPLYILAFSGIVNVCLNILCVAGFGLGVSGVAIGTIASQIVSAILVLIVFSKGANGVHFSISKLRIYKNEFVQILSIGIPAGINGILFSLSNVFIQSAINSFEKISIAAHSVAWNYMCFAFLFVNAGEQGVVCFVGQNIGAKKFDRIGKIVKTGFFVTSALTLAFSIIVMWQGKPLLYIFTNNSEIVAKGMIQIYCAISVYILYVPGVIFGGALRGMGKSILPTMINIIGICAVRVAWIAFIWPLNPTLEMVYYSFPVTWIASGIPMFLMYAVCKRKLLKCNYQP